MAIKVNDFRNNRERFYLVVMLAIGATLWACILWSIFRHWADPKIGHTIRTLTEYGVAFLLASWFASAIYRASAFGNMVLLGPNQFPELHSMVVDGAREIGLDEPPTTFLYNSNGVYNAFARRLLGGKYIFLTSALVEANNDRQVSFIIGHELGHHAAGHLNPWLNAVKFPAHLVPFLGKAYSRSREYTCDRIGAALSKDITESCRALQMLGCGCRRLNASMDCDAFAAQEDLVPGLFGFLAEINRSHPRLTRRITKITGQKPPRGFRNMQQVEPEFRITELSQ
jgi:Zn-dependent protease with chaperone function